MLAGAAPLQQPIWPVDGFGALHGAFKLAGMASLYDSLCTAVLAVLTRIAPERPA
jgi:hypothetical protein